jgi:predicted glycoside hydrolase/deacetylase ChbG (UPF0249 family)
VEGCTRLLCSFALLLCGPLLSASPTNVVGQAETSRHPGTPEQVYLIIRSDDAGMSHSVNMGLERLRSGLKIDYVDYHMGTVFYNPQFREIAERLAKEFGLDMNTDGGLPEMSKNRQGELDAVTSQRFRDALKARNVQLLTYRQLIAMQGLKSMRRPEG